ncbi:MAG: NADH-quinone oxidoreductase subunit NuoE [Nitrospira sp.]|nr:NADH-quinone oxidoreductase subunit NuoE [bacterium]MBL7049553.1 NADH-quinone oxidoreductase subunit NuoE [Nitrospira sp.]
MSLKVDEIIGVVSSVLDETQKKRGTLIHAFQEIQKEQNYLPEEELVKLSKELDIPMSDVYSTATFYKQFYFTPRGRKIVKVCTGTACHVRGASKVMDALKNEFNVGDGETTEDLAMTLESVGCIGCCGLAPVATINEGIIGEIDSPKLSKMIEDIKED